MTTLEAERELASARAKPARSARRRDRLASSGFGLAMLAPALIVVGLLFLAPVILTGVFSFTSMTTATGILGGAWQVDDDTIRVLRAGDFPAATLDALATEAFIVDDASLATAAEQGAQSELVAELASAHKGERFANRADFERFLKGLSARPSSVRELKAAATPFRRSVIAVRFETAASFRAALAGLGVDEPGAVARIEDAAYTGWRWTPDNYRRMLASSETIARFVRTVLYVSATVGLFNVGFALVLAISTFYLPARPAAAIRAVWLLPRILPPVLYVLLWKWLAWDNGFLSTVLGPLGIHSRNWLLDNSVNAWIFVILINGFVGASMGMIIFSSAIRAIPEPLFHASAVDGASMPQQVRYVILPQLRWPILFVTCYQTLSLLASFEYILLATNGGPGRSTEVWALAAYHTALSNYTGNLDYGLGAALAVVLVTIGLVVSSAYLRLFNFTALVQAPRIER